MSASCASRNETLDIDPVRSRGRAMGVEIEGVHRGRNESGHNSVSCKTPVGFEGGAGCYPGCAVRDPALLCNAFGVKNRRGFFNLPLKISHPH